MEGIATGYYIHYPTGTKGVPKFFEVYATSDMGSDYQEVRYVRDYREITIQILMRASLVSLEQ